MIGDLAGTRPEPPVAFTFDGERVEALPGQTVAAALIAHGRRTLRATRFAGASRGVFCGIGACFDCLVVHNGVPNSRACLIEAREGDVVEHQDGAGPAR